MNNNINNNDDYVVVEYTEESKKRMHRKSLKILTVAGITLVVLIVATYAWFVGNLCMVCWYYNSNSI